MNDNLPLQYFNDIIRRAEGNKYKTKGYKIPKAKLNKESFIKAIWVFSYTEQKHVIIYQ